MEAKFSPCVKDIISYSREEALATGCDFIGDEHLLLGILRYQSNEPCIAGLALKNRDINLTKFNYEIKTEIKRKYKNPNNKKISQGSIPLTKDAERAVKKTYLETKIYKGHTINSLHLLLAILRNEKSDTTKFLRKTFGVDYKTMAEFITSPDYKEIESLEATDGVGEIIELKENTPLSLVFDRSEFSNDDIKNIILLISEMYTNIGGDYLRVKGMNQFELTVELA